MWSVHAAAAAAEWRRWRDRGGMPSGSALLGAGGGEGGRAPSRLAPSWGDVHNPQGISCFASVLAEQFSHGFVRVCNHAVREGKSRKTTS